MIGSAAPLASSNRTKTRDTEGSKYDERVEEDGEAAPLPEAVEGSVSETGEVQEDIENIEEGPGE